MHAGHIIQKKNLFFPINQAGNLCASSLRTVLLDHHPYTASEAHMSKPRETTRKQKERISQKRK